MAPYNQREVQPSMFTPTKPHFYKIIFEDTIRDRKLRIPRKFVKKYGKDLLSSAEVVLIVSDGARWLVELTESGGDVWFQNGWQDFAEHYSLKHSDLLVFRHEGNCNFRVCIYDASATEIEYPCKLSHGEEQRIDEVCEESDEEEVIDDSSSDEIWCETLPSRKRRQTSQSPCSRPPKTLRKGKRESFGADEHATALERARAFKSENPFFVVEMQPSYIDPGRKLVLPSQFIKRCLKEKLGGVTLCTSDGRTWSAKYLRYETNNKYAKAVLYDGWRDFMQDNKLGLGDVCVFELVEQTKISLKVVIYRSTQDSNDHTSLDGSNERLFKSHHRSLMRPLTSHKKTRAFERASEFKSKNPFFKVVMQPAYLRSVGTGNCLNIPYKFAKKHLDGKEEVILQVSDGRSWIVKHSVQVVASGQHKAKFYHTWCNFVQDNNLEVGDVCFFELINSFEASFKVSIF